MDAATKPLSQIAAASGFTAADVAYLTNLDKAHVWRLWNNPEWLDKVSVASLQSLIQVLPGVGEYVSRQALNSAQASLSADLATVGLKVNEGVFWRLVTEDRVPEQYLGNALQAAVKIMQREAEKVAAHLMRFWGRPQDYALGFLFAGGGKGIISDPEPLFDASAEMVEQLAGRSTSFHAGVAHATLAHHLAKARGVLVSQSAANPRQEALAFRSGSIGMIIQSDDVAVSERYGRAVAASPVAGMVEDWSFPTYTRDAPITQNFAVPRTLPLVRTASEVMRELAVYPDAYVHYLTTVYLPRALPRDPSFGMQLPRLLEGVAERREMTQEPAVAHACSTFLKIAA